MSDIKKSKTKEKRGYAGGQGYADGLAVGVAGR
jgi:hypothetical protein